MENEYILGRIVVDVEQQRMGNVWVSITLLDDEDDIRERWTHIRVAEGDTITIELSEEDATPTISQPSRAPAPLLER